MRHSTAFLALVVMALQHTPVGAQVRLAEFRLHTRGDLWETMKDDGTIGAQNPTNRFEFFPSMDWPGGPNVLTSKDEQRSYSVGSGMWISGKKNGLTFFTESGPFTFVDQGTFAPILRQTNFVGSPGYSPNEAEELITAEWTTSEGIRVRRVSRMWSFPGFNKFVLVEYTLTNQSGTALSGVYVGFPALFRPSYQDFIVHNGWGDDLNRADDLVRYDSTLSMLYSYDDTPNFSLPYDVGNYWAQAAELRTTGYAGYALVSADPAADGRKQPANVLYAQLLGNERLLTTQSNSKDALYNILSGADRSLQAPPSLRLAPFVLMSCGPYNISPVGTVKIVMVYAVNGLPIDVALLGIDAIPLLPAGLDSLRASVTRAQQLYAAGYRLAAIPPPSPAADVTPLPTSKSIALTWPPIEDTFANPITGLKNIQGYNVYRSTRAFTGPYELISSIDAHWAVDRNRYLDQQLGLWRYIDASISLGVSYFYAVTTFDSLGMESWLTNRNENPVKAASEPAVDASKVKVFPNPFREVSGFPTRGEENSIVWTNLPVACTIRIYTASGEIVKTMQHQSATTGQEVWDQLTDSRQQTAPGIYFWTVESPVGNARGTLILIK